MRDTLTDAVKQIDKDLLDLIFSISIKLKPHKPFHVISGYRTPKTNALLFKRNKSGRDVLFIEASRDFEAGTNQNQLREQDLDKIVATYRARQSVDKYAYVADMAEIEENDFNLNIPRYVDTFEEEDEIDLNATRIERLQLLKELRGLEQEMAQRLEELGYES